MSLVVPLHRELKRGTLDGILRDAGVSRDELEEYLGENTASYYAALQAVQEGAYRPDRDAMPFVRFSVEAHIAQARRRLRQLAEAGARWAFLEQLVEQRGWPDRLVIALEQSLFHGADRASYADEADVSAPTASNDLRRLLDAGLISQQGRGPVTHYVASEQLARGVRGHQPYGDLPSNAAATPWIVSSP